MRKIIILVVALALLLLAACQSEEEQPTATAVPEAEPTQEPTAVPPAAVPTEADTSPVGNKRDALVAQPWQWLSFQGATEAFENLKPGDYLLTLNQDNTLSVKADCNNAAGNFTADESSLAITLGPTTLAACPEGSRSEQFLQLLPAAAKYFFEEPDLYIELMADGGTMRFVPAGAVADQPTLAPPTLTPIPPTAVPPTAVPPTSVPQLPGSVVDSGPRQYASGAYSAPYYTVAAGDTLFSISQRFGVPVDQIAAANGLVNNAIYAGQQLLITSGSGPVTLPSGVQYERVYFGAGGISTSLDGLIVQGQPKGYVLGGQAGQVLEIGTASNGEPLEVTVQSSDGRFFTLNGENGKLQNNLWLPLTETGDFYVTISPTSQPESPNLAFTITFIIQ